MRRWGVECQGFDEDGKGFDCPNTPGTPWGPGWCPSCDERRRARITRQLDDLLHEFDVVE